MPWTVVVTGGIASGKTAVSDRFAQLGVPVIDTDVIARQVVEPGTPALTEISRQFGPDFLDPSGRLDRIRMRATVFSDPEKRSRLEAIVHPAIAAEARRQVDAVQANWCLLVIPLFAQSERYSWVQRVLVVDVDEETQIQRVMLRDGIDREQALAILAAQSSRQDRLSLADDVIDNSGSLDRLDSQVQKLYEQYSAWAANGDPSNAR